MITKKESLNKIQIITEISSNLFFNACLNVKPFFFTFGFAHDYPNHYDVIFAESYDEARHLMFDKYKNKWAFQYELDEFKNILEKHALELHKIFVQGEINEKK